MNFIKLLNFYKMYKWELVDLKEQIGLNIKLKRLQKMISQPQLANEINFSKTHISRIENGEANITLATLIDLCNFLDIEITKLFVKINETERKILETEISHLEKEFKNQNKRKS